MELSPRGEAFLAGFEGGQSPDGLYHAYWDSYGRIETIGIGQTRINGGPVPPGTVWTREQAYADLRSSFAREYAPAINGLNVPLNQNQFDALASFVWNLGAGSMQWDVGRYLRAREYQAAADSLLNYDRAGGVVLAGLVTRRQAERRLFLTSWVDPDPHKYGLFDTTDRGFGRGHHGSERAIVQEYDEKRKHPFVHRPRLGRLRDDMSVLAGRLDNVIRDDPAGNSVNSRLWRRDQLAGRAQGRRYV